MAKNRVFSSATSNKVIQKDSEEGRARASLWKLAGLAHYVARYKKYLFLSLFFVILSGTVTLLLPYAIRLVVDHGFEGSDVAAFHMHGYFIGLFLVVCLLAFSGGGLVFSLAQLGENIVKDLRVDVFNHLIKLSPAFYDVNHSGELVSRLAADTNEIKAALTGAASVALRDIILIAGALVMMFVISPKLSLMALLTVPFLVLSLTFWGGRLRARTRHTQDCIAEANARASDYLSAVRAVQAAAAESRAMACFSALVEDAYQAMRRSLLARSILTASAMFLVFGGIVVILWVGAYDVKQQSMTAGQLSQFMIYTVIVGSSMGQLSVMFGQLSQAAGACERLLELLQEQTKILIPAQPEKLILPVRGDVRFSQVSFHYPTKPEHQILHQLSAHIAPGETAAFVGPSGGGKTTLFSLLLRFYDIEGHIFLDGQDIAKLNPEEVRRQIGYVSQDVTIFKGNFYDNIGFGVDHYTHEEIVEAAKIAQAYEFIRKYEAGFETELGERGVVLSGGQKQRIGIARAILQKSPVLLLDEATSALDTQSEKLVQEALNELMKDRTTLVIAHRLSTVLKADKIFVIDQGKIVETGTHQELLAKKGLYALLAKSQFEGKFTPDLAGIRP